MKVRAKRVHAYNEGGEKEKQKYKRRHKGKK